MSEKYSGEMMMIEGEEVKLIDAMKFGEGSYSFICNNCVDMHVIPIISIIFVDIDGNEHVMSFPKEGHLVTLIAEGKLTEVFKEILEST